MISTITRFVSLAALVGCTLAQQPNTDPNSDPFYFPSNLNSYTPGQVIASRAVYTEINAPGSYSYQISFRTTGNNGEPSSSVATVWEPAFKVGTPKLFAYQFAEDADNLDCAPSWAWVSGSNSHAQQAERVFQGPIVIPWALDQGYYVLSTDAEGPLSAWLVGNIEGQAVLDAIRAAIKFYNFSTGTGTPVALYDYSGAAHTTVWAATRAGTYAKELNIVGAAFGGTPVDIGAAYTELNDTPNSLLAGAAIFGLANGYPAVNAHLNTLLANNPAGQTIRNNLRANNNCTDNSAYMASVDYNKVFGVPNLLTDPYVQPVLVRESLLNGSSTPVPSFPILEYHGTNDTTVPFAPEQAYVKQQCKTKPSAQLFFTPFSGANHAETAILGLPGALSFIQQAFAGTVPTGTCGSPQQMPTPGSNAAIQIMNQTRDNELVQALSNGQLFNA